MRINDVIEKLHPAIKQGIQLKLPEFVEICSLCDGTGINKYDWPSNCNLCKHEKLHWCGSGFVYNCGPFIHKTVPESVIYQIYEMNKNVILVKEQLEK